MLTGKQIYSARKARHWTQAQLAERVGVSSEAISKWEHDVYAPDEFNKDILREVLGLDYLEEDGSLRNGRLFNEDRMSSFLKGKLGSGKYPNALEALAFAKEEHFGQLREPIELGIPYIIHPLTMACHALAMGLEDDVLLSAILLHDVCEDCNVSPVDLPVCTEARDVVRLVTKSRAGFSEEAYYERILDNPKACLVKCIDRCNNLSGMALGFPPAKIREYVFETEEWYPALLRVVKEVPAFNNAAWLLSYQIRSLLQTAKRIE